MQTFTFFNLYLNESLSSNSPWTLRATRHHLNAFSHTHTDALPNAHDSFIEATMSPRTTPTVPPHGLIGQTYDGDNVGSIGKQDDYKTYDHSTMTSAMGEGAIEGVASDYEMTSKFATDFPFSRFGATEAKVRDISKLSGEKVMLSERASAAGAS